MTTQLPLPWSLPYVKSKLAANITHVAFPLPANWAWGSTKKNGKALKPIAATITNVNKKKEVINKPLLEAPTYPYLHYKKIYYTGL